MFVVVGIIPVVYDDTLVVTVGVLVPVVVTVVCTVIVVTAFAVEVLVVAIDLLVVVGLCDTQNLECKNRKDYKKEKDIRPWYSTYYELLVLHKELMYTSTYINVVLPIMMHKCKAFTTTCVTRQIHNCSITKDNINSQQHMHGKLVNTYALLTQAYTDTHRCVIATTGDLPLSVVIDVIRNIY